MTRSCLAATAMLALLGISDPALAIDRRGAASDASSPETARPPSGAAVPVDRQTIRRLCESDLRIYCANVRPGGGRLMQCARANEAKLTAQCRSALQTVDAYRNARPQ